MKKQRQHKKTTRPKTRRRPELFTEPVRTNNDTREHKTHEQRDGPARTQTQKKRNGPSKSGIFFRTSEETECPSEKGERGSAVGPAREQKGATRGSMRSRSTSDKRSEDERRTNESININNRFYEDEIHKRQEERRRAKNE